MTQLPHILLGTHHAGWLKRPGPSLFVSRARMPKRPFVAERDFAIDSGGFTELSMKGAWTVPAKVYADEVVRWQGSGRLQWAAIQDWMCEPWILQKTGLSLEEHQKRTCDSFSQLRNIAPEAPWAPVLQGWAPRDYLWHLDLYAQRGWDLTREPIVGVGSVCRRQHMDEAVTIFRAVHRAGVRIHAFGLKLSGLERAWPYIASSDSLAWSYHARRAPGPMFPECVGRHKNCANCERWASAWHSRMGRRLEGYAAQQTLWGAAA